MSEWWLGLAAAEATVSCGGDHHRLRWEAGKLHALDHDDPESERTLAALGGEPCVCVEFLDAWEQLREDVRVLVLASRGPADPVLVEAEEPAQGGFGQPAVLSVPSQARRRRAGSVTTIGRKRVMLSGWTAYGPSGRASAQANEDNMLFALLGLGGGLPDRLVGAVAATWRERLVQPDRTVRRARPQLQAALHGRAFAAMLAWLGGTGLEVDLRMIGEGEEPALRSEDGVVHAELPFGWLVDVWARGLSTIWGRFCLAVATDDARTWRLTTVGPDLGPPAMITARLG